ncbi:MAG: polyprenol monophosphomannose synthase [Candidatus Wallbacteria bacterium]|nr:polyprenol monophosphomannose synthase [Candidatus Wallbacteria bacterium]
MKTVVTIPTYNESANIGALIDEIERQGIPGLHVLVVDDQSPDGTGAIVLQKARTRPWVKLLSRMGPRGRGSAGIDGFLAALADGADAVFEMDADFSHHPRYLPRMVELLELGYADVVIGSRFVEGGQDADRGLHRRVVTQLAGLYVRAILGVAVHDVSSGFRGFTRRTLEAVRLDTCVSTGPSIVLEVLSRVCAGGARIVEFPIVFEDRVRGESTLTLRILLETLRLVWKFRTPPVAGADR